jgi:Flp pilus assembly pilin Flp
MRTLYERLHGFSRNDSGQDLIEYAILAGLIALSSTVLLPDLGDNMRSMYGRASAALHRTSDSVDATMVRSADGPIAVMDQKPSKAGTESTTRRRR